MLKICQSPIILFQNGENEVILDQISECRDKMLHPSASVYPTLNTTQLSGMIELFPAAA